MKRCLLVLTACLHSWNLPAQETLDETAFLEFIKANPKSPTPKELPTPTPSEAMAMLEKWKAYEKAETTKLQAGISAARAVAVEMLTKKALGANGAARESLMKEVDAIRALSPEALLSYIPGSNEARYRALVGVWAMKDAAWRREYQPRGTVLALESGNASWPWHWIDGEAGVVGTANGYADLFWMEKPGVIRGINNRYWRFTLSKTSAALCPPTDPVIVKLNATEATQRSALNALLATQRNRVITWLLDKAKNLPAAEVSNLMQKIRNVESEADAKSGFASKLTGLWRWEKTDLLFQPYGIVASKTGRKLGQWDWVEPDFSRFAIVLNGGKTGADIFIAPPPADSHQISIEAHQIVGGKITATRTLP